ncbi:MAG: alpha/beta hydrolase [Pseudomonadota bacterium]
MKAEAETRPVLYWIPGHLCDARLYVDQWAAFQSRAEQRLAETRADADLGAMAERLIAQAPPRFAIAGLSMGGMVAMEVLARAPDRVIGAALLDTDPTPARPKEIAWRAEMRSRVRDDGIGAFVDVFVSKFFTHSARTEDALAAQVRDMMIDAGESVFRTQSDALDARRDTRAAVARYAGPLAIICGAEDRVCPPKLHWPLGLGKNADLTVVPGCGHLATLEAPHAVNAALSNWLDALPPP